MLLWYLQGPEGWLAN